MLAYSFCCREKLGSRRSDNRSSSAPSPVCPTISARSLNSSSHPAFSNRCLPSSRSSVKSLPPYFCAFGFSTNEARRCRDSNASPTCSVAALHTGSTAGRKLCQGNGSPVPTFDMYGLFDESWVITVVSGTTTLRRRGVPLVLVIRRGRDQDRKVNPHLYRYEKALFAVPKTSCQLFA